MIGLGIFLVGLTLSVAVGPAWFVLCIIGLGIVIVETTF
jgi:hypothetical protein